MISFLLTVASFMFDRNFIISECGGNVATSLRIGSSEGQSDIVDEGKPTPRYKVGIDNLGTAHSDEHLHLPDNQSDWTIYMRNAFTGEKGPPSKDGALQIGRITLTIEHPDKVAAATPKVSVLGPASWRDTNAASYVLEAEADLRVSFHFICRKKGESRILITVPVLQHETLEFGIAKECEHEAAAPRKSREFVITVRSVFWSFIFLVVICVAIFCIRRRTASAKGFEPLPVTER